MLSVRTQYSWRTRIWNNINTVSMYEEKFYAFRQNPVFLKDQNMNKYQHCIDVRGEVLCFPSEPNIPEGPEYEIISTLYRCTGRSFMLSVRTQYSWTTRIWININTVSMYGEKFYAFRQNPIFLMDQNMKKYQHCIDVRGEVLCFPSEPNIPERPEYEKISTLSRCTGRNFNIRNQQTRFYWICSWELMESATILMPP